MKSEFSTKQIIESIRKANGNSEEFLPLHAPVFGPSAIKYTNECVETGWVSSAGAFVDRFESDLAKLTGAKRAVAVVNGTAALHVALLLAGVQPNEEVLSPSFTFIATGNAIHYCNATPHFIDVEKNTLGICAEKLQAHLRNVGVQKSNGLFNKLTGKRIAAVIGMHVFGHPFDLNPVLEVCSQFSIPLIEDAAESIGSYYQGTHTGTFGRLGILSFNGNKTITTGGGGAILTQDEGLADQAKHLTTTAKRPHPYRYIHDVIGFNYRMPNINAALGCSQLEDLPEILGSKRKLAEAYFTEFENVDGARILKEPKDCHSNYWLNAIVLEERHSTECDRILEELNAAQILSRPIWHPLHQLEIYSNCPRADLSCTENLAPRIINIPSSPNLSTTPRT